MEQSNVIDIKLKQIMALAKQVCFLRESYGTLMTGFNNNFKELREGTKDVSEEIQEQVAKDPFTVSILSIVDETRDLFSSLSQKGNKMKEEIVKALCSNEELNLAFVAKVKSIPKSEAVTESNFLREILAELPVVVDPKAKKRMEKLRFSSFDQIIEFEETEEECKGTIREKEEEDPKMLYWLLDCQLCGEFDRKDQDWKFWMKKDDFVSEKISLAGKSPYTGRIVRRGSNVYFSDVKTGAVTLIQAEEHSLKTTEVGKIPAILVGLVEYDGGVYVACEDTELYNFKDGKEVRIDGFDGWIIDMKIKDDCLWTLSMGKEVTLINLKTNTVEKKYELSIEGHKYFVGDKIVSVWSQKLSLLSLEGELLKECPMEYNYAPSIQAKTKRFAIFTLDEYWFVWDNLKQTLTKEKLDYTKSVYLC